MSDAREMHQGRVMALRRIMRSRGLERALLDAPESISYLTGYTPATTMYQACVLTQDRGPLLVVRANNRKLAESQAYCEAILSYRDWDDPIGVLAGVIAEHGGSGPIGKDMGSMVMTARRQSRLADLGVHLEPTDISDGLDALRAVKSAPELDLHRRAAAIADAATLVGVESLASGATLQQAAIAAHGHARESGADDRRSVVAKSETAHESTPGPAVSMIELVPAVKGYDARLIRSVASGKPTAEQLANAGKVIGIQDLQIESMIPGARAADVDAVCRDQMLSEGLRETYDGLTGHGIGFSWAGNTTDSTYSFTPAADWALEAGMIFHMYTRARGFVIGDTILVTDTGPERLTRLERGLLAGSGDVQ